MHQLFVPIVTWFSNLHARKVAEPKKKCSGTAPIQNQWNLQEHINQLFVSVTGNVKVVIVIFTIMALRNFQGSSKLAIYSWLHQSSVSIFFIIFFLFILPNYLIVS